MHQYKKKDKKYFRLIDRRMNQLTNSNKQEKDPSKITMNLIKNRKYIYLDLNSTNGFKAMQNVQTQSDEDDQRYGPYVICEGSKSSRQKIKLNEFITINHSNRQKTNLLRSKVKSELQKSKQKINSLHQNKRHDKYSNINNLNQMNMFHRGIDTEKFNIIKSKMELETINQDILNKQQKIIQKFGIVSNYQSVQDKGTPSYNEKTKRTQNYFLPKILKSYF